MESIHVHLLNISHRKGASMNINGKLYSLGKEGYVDVIKDGFVITSARIENRRFHINMPEGSKLRIRVQGSLWKCIKPDTTLLKIVLLPYFILWPYRMLEEAITAIIKTTFNTRLSEKLINLKVWRK